MSPHENIEVILRLYKAFAKADIQTVLDNLSHEVEWTEGGYGLIPWGGVWHGPRQVASCFRILNETLANQELYPREILAQDERVIVLGDSVAVVKANQRRVEQSWVMAWTLADGMVTHCRYYDDT